MEYSKRGMAQAAALPDPAGWYCGFGPLPVVQYGSQLILNPEMRDPNYNFVTLFSNVVWGNTQMFLPLSLVMIAVG